MKTTTRFCLFTVIVAAFFLFVSCDGIGSSKMNSESAVKRIVKAYEKNIDTNVYRPVSMSWMETEELSNNLVMLNFVLVDRDDNLYSQTIKVGGDYQGAYDIEDYKFSRTAEFDTTEWITIEDIDAALILSQYDDAISQIPDGYKFKSVGICYMDPERYGKGGTEFTINIIEKGKSKSVTGGSLVTNYYELQFLGNPDGTATFLED